MVTVINNSMPTQSSGSSGSLPIDPPTLIIPTSSFAPDILTPKTASSYIKLGNDWAFELIGTPLTTTTTLEVTVSAPVSPRGLIYLSLLSRRQAFSSASLSATLATTSPIATTVSTMNLYNNLTLVSTSYSEEVTRTQGFHSCVLVFQQDVPVSQSQQINLSLIRPS